MSWIVVPQDTRHGEALVTTVRFYPYINKKTGKQSFGLLTEDKWARKVVIRNTDTRITLTLKHNPTSNTYVIQHEDKEEYPTISTRRGPCPDVLAPRVTVRGLIERYDTKTEFMDRLIRFSYEGFAELVGQLLIKGQIE